MPPRETERYVSIILYYFLRFEVFKALNMKNAILCDVNLCSSCKNQHFGGKHHLRHQGEKNQQARNNIISN
jgi:hypothetical protein